MYIYIYIYIYRPFQCLPFRPSPYRPWPTTCGNSTGLNDPALPRLLPHPFALSEAEPSGAWQRTTPI